VYGAAFLCETLCVPLRLDPPLHRRRVAFFTHHREFDCSKAVRLLGYVPRVSAAEGIARTAQWYRSAGYLGAVGTRPGAMAHGGRHSTASK